MLQEHDGTATLMAIQIPQGCCAIAPKWRCGAAVSTYVDGPSSTQVDDQLVGSSGATLVAKLGGAHTMKPPWRDHPLCMGSHFSIEGPIPYNTQNLAEMLRDGCPAARDAGHRASSLRILSVSGV